MGQKRKQKTSSIPAKRATKAKVRSPDLSEIITTALHLQSGMDLEDLIKQDEFKLQKRLRNRFMGQKVESEERAWQMTMTDEERLVADRQRQIIEQVQGQMQGQMQQIQGGEIGTPFFQIPTNFYSLNAFGSPNIQPVKEEEKKKEPELTHGFQIADKGHIIIERKDYDNLHVTIQLQNKGMERILKQPARKLATILRRYQNRRQEWCLLLTDGSQPFESDFPMDLYQKLLQLNPYAYTYFDVGHQVYIADKTKQVTDICELKQAGEIYTVVEDNGDLCSAERYGVKVYLYKNSELKINAGEKVLVNGQKVVLEVIKEKPKTYGTNPKVNWDAVGGHEVAKREIQQAIRNLSGIAKKFGKKESKGILLFGPPGCGKTMLAKAAATELLGENTGGFIYIKGPEILSRYVGDSESSIRAIFADAREFKKQTGNRCIIFIDEAEAILSKRGETKGANSFMSGTIVPQFLSEWDGLDDSGAMLILATNRANDLDEAIMREGRIDRKINVPRPDRNATKTIVELYLKKTILAGDIVELAEHTALKIFANFPAVKNKVCGALLSNLVDRAIGYAIDRSTEEELSPVAKNDLEKAIGDMEHEYQAVA